MNYEKCLELLKKRDTKRVANNTKLHRNDGYVSLVFHDTAILKFYPEFVEYNIDSFNTKTTKERLNQFGPSIIYQQKGLWYFTDNSIYTEGVRIDYNGIILNPEIQPKNNNEQLEMKKLIKKYVDSFDSHIKDGLLQFPSNSDCWYCSGMIPGDDTYHLLSHIEENYFVPSLLLNAIKERGYNNPSFIFHMIKDNNFDCKPILRKYLTKRLIKVG